MLKDIKEKIYSSPEFRIISDNAGKSLFFTGIRGSLTGFILAKLYDLNKKLVFCSNDQTKLFKLKDDLNLIIGSEKSSLYLGEFDEEFESDITPLSSTLKTISTEESYILLTSPAALDKNILSETSFSPPSTREGQRPR